MVSNATSLPACVNVPDSCISNCFCMRVCNLCCVNPLVAMIELRELEESQVSVESVRGWCVEEQAMEMDIAVLQQVEELERKVTAASLQVKVNFGFPSLCCVAKLE